MDMADLHALDAVNIMNAMHGPDGVLETRLRRGITVNLKQLYNRLFVCHAHPLGYEYHDYKIIGSKRGAVGTIDIRECPLCSKRLELETIYIKKREHPSEISVAEKQ
jgi:hypothetical protein